MSQTQRHRSRVRNESGQRLHRTPPLEPRARKALPAEAPTNLLGEWELFREFFEKFLQLRTQLRSEPPPPKKLWTPRSHDPISSIPARPLLRPKFVRRRVHFACPACHRMTELPSVQAGQKGRCPRCGSAIQVPHPTGRHFGRNLERDVESVLHPERFEILPTRGIAAIRTRHIHQGFVLFSLAVSVLLVIGHGFRKVLRYKENPAALFTTQAVDPITKRDLRFESEDVVRRFLSADGWREKCEFVRDRERIAPLMRTYYSKHLGGAPIDCAVESDGMGYYDGANLSAPISHVRADTKDGMEFLFVVEHTESGPVIEWESSIGYSASDWRQAVTAEAPSAMRVLAALDDYYNFNVFNDADSDLCLRLQDPQTNELMGYGYLKRSDPEAESIASLLAETTRDNPRPLFLEIAATAESAKTNQVRITRILADGWRTGTPVMANAGN